MTGRGNATGDVRLMVAAYLLGVGWSEHCGRWSHPRYEFSCGLVTAANLERGHRAIGGAHDRFWSADAGRDGQLRLDVGE